MFISVEILNARPYECKLNSNASGEIFDCASNCNIIRIHDTRRVEDIRQRRAYKLRKRDVSSFLSPPLSRSRDKILWKVHLQMG